MWTIRPERKNIQKSTVPFRIPNDYHMAIEQAQLIQALKPWKYQLKKLP